jgi:hypothetical protein
VRRRPPHVRFPPSRQFRETPNGILRLDGGIPQIGRLGEPKRYAKPPEHGTDEQLGQTYFDGLHNDPESVERLKNKYNFHSANLLLLRLNNC